MNKFNAGIAPLAIVLIIVAVLVIGGGGVYLATRGDTEVAVSTATPTASSSLVPTSTATSKPVVSSTPTPTSKSTVIPTQKPIATATMAPKPSGVSYATIQDAVNSGKNVTCIGAWYASDGKGASGETRLSYYVNGSYIKLQYDNRPLGGGTIVKGVTYEYTPTSPNYANVLKYSLASVACTQQ